MAEIWEVEADPVAAAAAAVSAAARKLATRAKTIEKCQPAASGPRLPLPEVVSNVEVIVPNFCTPLTAIRCLRAISGELNQSLPIAVLMLFLAVKTC